LSLFSAAARVIRLKYTLIMLRKTTRYKAHYSQIRNRGGSHVRRFSGHPVAIPVFTLAGLLLITAVIFWFMNRTPGTIDPNVVVISYDDKQEIVSSKESTVGTLLNKLDIAVNEGDVVEPALETPIQQDDFRINIYRAKPIEINDSGQKVFAKSARTTERGVAQQSGLVVYPEDKLTTEPITDFTRGAIGEEVVVDRATPVNVNLYGAPVVMRTHADTIGGLLKERNIRLAEQDQVKPDASTPITPNAQIAVIRNGLSTVTVTEDIGMPVENVTDANLAYGTSAVRQKGAPGKKAVTYEINTQNGVEVGRRAIQTTVIQPPVSEIRVVGANLSGIKGDMARAGISPDQYQYADYIISRESGWCPTKWQGQYGGCPAYHGTPTSAGVGYGLCQSTPAWKMASAGADWGTNPVTQLKWCTGYANSRYGSWQNAYNFWVSHHWW
jgi:resuscitation-promoting factor RpfB